MCAIAGFLKVDVDLPHNSKELLIKMLEHMRHRGPDGQGMHVDAQQQFAFGQARLAIIAPSAEGLQPFFSHDKTVAVVFNGEIYNYVELRTELEVLGHNFVTKTDTEVLVAAYLQWGQKFVDKFSGMFAIALFDALEQKFLLLRDRFGAKPLYFSLQGGLLSFASEVRALTALPWVAANVNMRAAYDYLTFMSIPAPQSYFTQIYKLPAGYMLELDANKNLSFEQWYCPVRAVSAAQLKLPKMALPEVVEHTTSLLQRSVQRRLVSDVPVAIFLSGGLDSSLLTALAAQGGKAPTTFNIFFKDDPGSDEKLWARRVAEIYGTQHHEIEIVESEVQDLVTQMLERSDQPLADCVNVPLLKIAQACRAQGFKVALVGEGADELFFGYPEYRREFYLQKMLWGLPGKYLPSWLFKMAFRVNQTLGKKVALSRVLFNRANNLEPFWGNATAFQEYEKQAVRSEILKSNSINFDPLVQAIYPGYNQELGSQNLINFFAAKINQFLPTADFVQRIALLELQHRIPDLLLARVDAMTMAAGLEGREPFLDHELVEFVLALPQQQRFALHELKFLLKMVARKFLPEELVQRKKTGFSAPVKDWFGAQLLQPNLATGLWAKLLNYDQNPVKQWTLYNLCKYQF